jgi:LytS/YehU family sensor histidine kinase
MPRAWVFSERFPAWTQWPIRFGALILISLVATPAAIATVFLLSGWNWAEFSAMYTRAQPTAILITFIIGGGMTVYHALRHRLEETTLALRTQQLANERAMKLAREAQLSSLESRLHPHFLFNTINSISSLIREDPQRAERMLEQMAALLRFSLDAGRTPTVPLERELKVVRDYLEIEHARFGDRLRYRFDVPLGLESWPTPPLSVQTLVENSIKHAIAPRRHGGEVLIAASNGNGRLRVSITDHGPGFDRSALLAGHGLDTLEMRLKTLYGDAASLLLERQTDAMTVAIEVPAKPIRESLRR